METRTSPDTKKDEELDFGATFFVGVVGALAIVIAVILLSGLYYRTEDRLSVEADAQPVFEVKKVVSEQQELLNGWSDVQQPDGKRTIRVPIDRAIEIVAREGAPSPPAPPAPRPLAPIGRQKP
jgi:hypothetical protein